MKCKESCNDEQFKDSDTIIHNKCREHDEHSTSGTVPFAPSFNNSGTVLIAPNSNTTPNLRHQEDNDNSTDATSTTNDETFIEKDQFSHAAKIDNDSRLESTNTTNCNN